MNWREYISVDPAVCDGKACVAGTRVLVSAILDDLADGMNMDGIVRAYPPVSRDAIRAALLYAAELTRREGAATDHEISPRLKKEDVLHVLREHKATFAERFGVTDLALFGSYARGQAMAGSDVDILVGFDGPATSKAFFGLQSYLENLLHCRVDLVTQKALRPELRPQIEREAVHV